MRCSLYLLLSAIYSAFGALTRPKTPTSSLFYLNQRGRVFDFLGVRNNEYLVLVIFTRHSSGSVITSKLRIYKTYYSCSAWTPIQTLTPGFFYSAYYIASDLKIHCTFLGWHPHLLVMEPAKLWFGVSHFGYSSSMVISTRMNE